MKCFSFKGDFFNVSFNFSKTAENELAFDFGDIQFRSDFYYWFVNQELLLDTAFSRRVCQLCDSNEPETAFAVMLKKMVEAWIEIVQSGSGNMLVGFFDEGCQIIQTGSENRSTTHLSYSWTSEVHGYFGHPIDLQEEFGKQKEIDLIDMDEPNQEVKTNKLIGDLEDASERLLTKINS